MASRTRKRYGNGDGGGFPLGQILALSMGGGGANPAFGAETPGDVSYTYKGDPSEAMAKYGTSKPYIPNNAFQKFYGMDDADKANKDYSLGKLEAADRLSNQKALEQWRQEQQLEMVARMAAAQGKAAEASRGELVARLAPEVQNMAVSGELPDLGLPSPVDPRTPAGAQTYANSMTLRYPSMEKLGMYPSLAQGETGRNVALGAGYERPGLAEETTAKQSADIGKNRLVATQTNQERATREKHPERVEASLLGEFDAPALSAEKARNQLPWSKYYQTGEGLLLNPNDLSDVLTFTPASKGGEMTGFDAAGKPIYSVARPPMPNLLHGGDVIRRKQVPVTQGAGANFTPAPPVNVQSPAPLTPSLGASVNKLPSLHFDFGETESQKAAKKALERQAAESALEALKAKLRGINMSY